MIRGFLVGPAWFFYVYGVGGIREESNWTMETYQCKLFNWTTEKILMRAVFSSLRSSIFFIVFPLFFLIYVYVLLFLYFVVFAQL